MSLATRLLNLLIGIVRKHCQYITGRNISILIRGCSQVKEGAWPCAPTSDESLEGRGRKEWLTCIFK